MKKSFIFLALILIAAVVVISGCTSSDEPAESPLNVTDLRITSGGFGTYDVTGIITPNKDIDYLEMVAISYDSSGAVIDRSPLVWNINDAKAGQQYKINGMMFISGDDRPSKVDILIFDSPFSGASEEGNIYKETVQVG